MLGSRAVRVERYIELGGILQMSQLRRWLFWLLALVVVVVAIATVFLGLEEGSSPRRALLTVLLVFGSGNTAGVEFEAIHGATQVLIVAVEYAGLLTLAILFGVVVDLVLRIRLPDLFAGKGQRMKDHMIVVGYGQMGFRVSEEFDLMGLEYVIVVKDDQSPFLSRAKKQKTPIIMGDIHDPATLSAAGIDNARAVIACTDDDLANLEIALDARQLVPNIRVVVRIFDQRLAAKIAEGFDIQVAFSMTALAAPAFAAASIDRSVQSSFRVADEIWINCTFRIPSESGIVALTTAQLREEYGIHTLRIAKGERELWAPALDSKIPQGGVIQVVGSLNDVHRLKETYGITEDLIRAHAG